MATIVWTRIDEAPALASYSLLPIVQGFLHDSGVEVTTSDISLASRILAQFPERLDADQQVPDHLAELGALTADPTACIIKLPNISASVPQLKAAIAELQSQGFDIPDLPEHPDDDASRQIAARYASVLGSAVNPVLRQGNSDRRAPAAVKAYAKAHPHRLGPWTPDNRARVAHMADDDFYGHETSFVSGGETLSIVHVGDDGTRTVLADGLEVLDGEIVDATYLSVAALDEFYEKTLQQAKEEDLLWSVHLKATMMKVSDPVLFGHAVRTFLADVFDRFGEDLATVGVNPDLGLADLLAKVDTLPQDRAEAVRQAIDAAFAARPALAMVDSDKGISNLHAGNNVIIDASMPTVVRDSGCMWNARGEQQQTLAVIPDRSYATIYAAIMDDCRANGALDPATMGDVPNVGLMAQKAEEYGSHATTFILDGPGRVEVRSGDEVRVSQPVAAGDIWRMSRVRDIPVRDWVRLAVDRARITGAPAVFWLDGDRAHDRLVIEKVKAYLPEHDTTGLEIRILPPADAMKYTLERVRRGEDTISVTGNVLRDYLTDLFPILEIGTSAKMLSIVPLLAGGGLFETGAGGSAPKHVAQFIAEDYLRWDSLGEFCALQACLDHIGRTTEGTRAAVLAKTLDTAIGAYLENDRSPARRLGQIDNRGSQFYLALYWSQALATQLDDARLAGRFGRTAESLDNHTDSILAELLAVQGHPVDLGGYYRMDDDRARAAMRPSETFNAVVDGVLNRTLSGDQAD
ncbi:NADP-dependent isocitrate dehydrogenase [Acidipropionibacterium jensenii]|uniref:NADP-dependent isocitrate dehydrogenase n=1 Tax=Acidipropionibacterium jensenii TaxID=1749 RepID=UPI00264A2428|nr:NADP-dependent isocitrate dehydrogenase [Acidipropionibacterium jensenii]MDN5995651.1 NADP-dependent isocitrate dehydrogenase [Acidipropionibacterium jensenii]MDN6442734.1 NADP-dependent isocitrate dehydrogenase [Acidipropionibacterium jensenii]MDN6479416.1 NADP-dependent isocitrate dehydrogenase [Acidipropionibacterium jensenii]MDN6513687.1 NADP-dependent isocitrate dehydrogenase [Acidipropionibacterium jensenii]MDN6592517.1 NADP-dependent isocitrate dehydrogenase [Acidipropionibacterium j